MRRCVGESPARRRYYRDTIGAVFLGKLMLIVAALLVVAWAVGGFLKNLR
jgi:hypothetical protein